jgi:hypothetical protein
VALPHHLRLHRGLPGEIRFTKAIGEVTKAILKGSRDNPCPLGRRRPRLTGG